MAEYTKRQLRYRLEYILRTFSVDGDSKSGCYQLRGLLEDIVEDREWDWGWSEAGISEELRQTIEGGAEGAFWIEPVGVKEENRFFQETDLFPPD